MSEMTLVVRRREDVGKNANRRLRSSGEIPAVVYGEARDPIAIRVSNREMHELLKKAGDNAVFLLQLDGTDQKRHTMIREVQYDPITGRMMHIDFLRINLEQKVRVTVPIEAQGTPLGVKNEGGMVDFVTREVEIECLPNEIPAHLDVDISQLHIGQHLEVKDLALPSGVTLLDDPTRVVVSVSVARVAEAAAEGEEEELLEAERAEPEVVKRGKEEEEEG